jgi:hypothetical protein
MTQSHTAAADQICKPPILGVAITLCSLFDFDRDLNRDGTLAVGSAAAFVHKISSINKGRSADERVVQISLVITNENFVSSVLHQSLSGIGLSKTDVSLVYVQEDQDTVANVINAGGTHLFVSTHAESVVRVMEAGIPAVIAPTNVPSIPLLPEAAIAGINKVVFAFDFDRAAGVAFGRPDTELARMDSDIACDKVGGGVHFEQHEMDHANHIAERGPMQPLLFQLSQLRQHMKLNRDKFPNIDIELHIVTARSAACRGRVENSLAAWGVEVDGIHTCGLDPKFPVLIRIGADFFVDDKAHHVRSARPDISSFHAPWTAEHSAKLIAAVLGS